MGQAAHHPGISGQASALANPFLLQDEDHQAIASAQDFVRLFEAGEWAPHALRLEESEILHDLASSDPGQHVKLEGLITGFKKKASFALASALHSVAPGLDVVIVVDTHGIPFHCYLRHRISGLLLDAQGVQTPARELARWTATLKDSNTTLKSVSVDEIWFYGRFSDKYPEPTLQQFGYLAEFMSQNAHQLAQAPSLRFVPKEHELPDPWCL
mgnify:CR=1 FL=1|jgi:hypothetical protein